MHLNCFTTSIPYIKFSKADQILVTQDQCSQCTMSMATTWELVKKPTHDPTIRIHTLPRLISDPGHINVWEASWTKGCPHTQGNSVMLPWKALGQIHGLLHLHGKKKPFNSEQINVSLQKKLNAEGVSKVRKPSHLANAFIWPCSKYPIF